MGYHDDPEGEALELRLDGYRNGDHPWPGQLRPRPRLLGPSMAVCARTSFSCWRGVSCADQKTATTGMAACTTARSKLASLALIGVSYLPISLSLFTRVPRL